MRWPPGPGLALAGAIALGGLAPLSGCGAETADSGGTDYVPQMIVDPDGGVRLDLGAVDRGAVDAEPGDAEPGDARPGDAARAGDADTAPGDAAIEPDAQGEDLRAPFVGYWAQAQYQAGVSALPVLGDVDTTTIGTLRVEIRPDPDDVDGLIVLTETCQALITREIDVVETIIPPSFIAALEITERRAQIDGARLVAPSFIELRGVVLDDEGEPLPTEPDDPRVLDLDEDGHPGLTVRVAGLIDGEVYLVQRQTSDLDGVLEGDRLDGLVGWLTEESVLGSDNPALAMGAPLVPDPDPAASTFRSTRISSERDCAWILANTEALFAR